MDENFAADICSAIDPVIWRRNVADLELIAIPQIQLEGGRSRVYSAGHPMTAATTTYQPVIANIVFHILKAETMGCALSGVTVPGFIS